MPNRYKYAFDDSVKDILRAVPGIEFRAVGHESNHGGWSLFEIRGTYYIEYRAPYGQTTEEFDDICGVIEDAFRDTAIRIDTADITAKAFNGAILQDVCKWRVRLVGKDA